MSEVSSLPANENLLSSVLSELKCRVKNPPPPIPCKSNKVISSSAEKPKKLPPIPPPKESKPTFKYPPKNLKKEDALTNEEQDVSGIAEYAAYCKNVGFSSEDKLHESHTFPFFNKGSTITDDGPSNFKPATPPSKPIRRNMHVNTNARTKPVFQRPGLNNTHIASQLHELFESAFSSTSDNNDKGQPIGNSHRSRTVPHFRPHDIYISNDGCDTNTNTLKEHDTNMGFKQSLESIDSGHGGSAKSAKPVEDIDDCFDIEGIYMLIEQNPDGGNQLDDRCHSDEGHHSNESGENGKNEGDDCCVDNISLTSNDSADELAGTKVIVKRIKARERARQLKKHASNQKKSVGAFLDAAASNASDRIKKFRRPSLKFSHGTSKALQNLANKIGSSKNNEEQVSNPNGSGSENEGGDKKPQPPVRRGSLLTSSDRSDLCDDHKTAPMKCGYLKKQGGKIKTWHERWFILKGDKLDYFKDVDGKYLGSIYLSGARVISYPPRNNSNDTHKYVFEIFPAEHNRGAKMNTNHESYVLSASSHADMEEWVKAIRRLILSPFGGGIFGQRLDETMKHDRRVDSTKNGSSLKKSVSPNHSGYRQVPIIVENCIDFIRSNDGLKEEGLFRLPGQANEVKDLQDAYDMGERPTFTRNTDVHTVASLLKGYLRELPEPAIPFDRYCPLIEAAKLSKRGGDSPKAGSENEPSKEKEEASKLIKDQIQTFPQPNFDLLKYICRFLDEVQSYSKSNKMDIYNLSMIFGPNLMKARKEDAVTMMTDAVHVQHIVYLLIENHGYFFASNSDGMEEASGENIPEELADDANVNGDAGIGTLTTTASPLGTLGLRHTNDDSGTGSLAPTPDNTNKRTLASHGSFPSRKPTKPNKPVRSKLVGQNIYNGNSGPLLPSGDNEPRKSYYDNVTTSSAGSPKSRSSSNEWRRSKHSSDASSERVTNSSTQDSYYVNNRSTPSASLRSSTHAVAGSAPDSYPSSTTDNVSNPRTRFQPRLIRRPRIVRRSPRNLSDEESNTESIGTDERAFSTVSSHRSSYNNSVEHPESPSHPRTSSCPLLKYTSHNGNLSDSKRLSIGSGSDGASSGSSLPTAPARCQRIPNGDGNKVSHLDVNSVLPPESTRSSNITSLGTSVSARPLTYIEMEEQIHALKDEISIQRLEHEKRSRMLEEHYVMKMRSSSSGFGPITSPDPYSSHGFGHLQSFSSIRETEDPLASPTESNACRGMSVTDDYAVDPADPYFYRAPSAVSRALSTESQAEMRYREEMKRHAITKIRLRNVERGLKQAEERNEQLQKEVEHFFETFGSMLPHCPT